VLMVHFNGESNLLIGREGEQPSIVIGREGEQLFFFQNMSSHIFY
jgi:hypothetical protein